MPGLAAGTALGPLRERLLTRKRINAEVTHYSSVGRSPRIAAFRLIPATALGGPNAPDILVFPQSSGGFWGGVTECGLGSTGPPRHAAPCRAQSREGGARVGSDPVNAIVDGQSGQATTALDGPAADAVLVADGPAPAVDAGDLDAGAAVNGTADTANGADGNASGAVSTANGTPVAADGADLGDIADADTDADADADSAAE